MIDVKLHRGLNFSTLPAKAARAYEIFPRYFDAWRNKKDGMIGSEGFEIAMDLAHPRMLEFVIDETNRLAKHEVLTKDSSMQECLRQATNEYFFEVVTSLVDIGLTNIIRNNSINAFVEFRNGAFGDSFEFKIRARDLFVVSKSSNMGIRHAFNVRTYNGNQTVTAETRQLTVDATLWELISGKYNLAEFVSKIVMSFAAEMKKDALTVLNGGVAKLSTSGSNQLKLVGTDDRAMLEIAQRIYAWSDGVKPSFYGTDLALSNIVPPSTNTMTNYNDIDSEFNKIGYLRDYKGYKAIALEPTADPSVEFDIMNNNDYVYIIGNDRPVKVCLEGSTLSYVANGTDEADMKTRTTLTRKWGTAFIPSALIGFIDFSQ